MARTTITATDLPKTGLNLTDASFTTMATGSNNGVKFEFNNRNFVILKNDTGGAATFTLIVTAPASLSAVGVTPSNQTIVVADGKTYLLVPGQALLDADRNINIDCDVAGKILLRNVPAE